MKTALMQAMNSQYEEKMTSALAEKREDTRQHHPQAVFGFTPVYGVSYGYKFEDTPQYDIMMKPRSIAICYNKDGEVAGLTLTLSNGKYEKVLNDHGLCVKGATNTEYYSVPVDATITKIEVHLRENEEQTREILTGIIFFTDTGENSKFFGVVGPCVRIVNLNGELAGFKTYRGERWIFGIAFGTIGKAYDNSTNSISYAISPPYLYPMKGRLSIPTFPSYSGDSTAASKKWAVSDVVTSYAASTAAPTAYREVELELASAPASDYADSGAYGSGGSGGDEDSASYDDAAVYAESADASVAVEEPAADDAPVEEPSDEQADTPGFATDVNKTSEEFADESAAVFYDQSRPGYRAKAIRMYIEDLGVPVDGVSGGIRGMNFQLTDGKEVINTTWQGYRDSKKPEFMVTYDIPEGRRIAKVVCCNNQTLTVAALQFVLDNGQQSAKFGASELTKCRTYEIPGEITGVYGRYNTDIKRIYYFGFIYNEVVEFSDESQS
jgi:hypothetical protein